MPAPTTPLLTTFTGADEDPVSEGGTWLGPIQNGARQLRRVSNTVARSNTGAVNVGQSYFNTSFAADQEVYATAPTLPGATDSIAVWGRIHNPGNATTAEAYLGVWTNGTGWRLFKFTVGTTFTQVGSTTASPAMVDTEKIGLVIIGTSLELFHFTGGSWVSRVTGTDSVIAGAGFIGAEIAGAVALLDDFGGGVSGRSIRSQHLDFDYSR